MKISASDKRLAAIGQITRQFIQIVPEGGTQLVPGTERAAVKAAIEALRPLGRTERWQTNLTTWGNMVSDEDLMWAIMQGAIYAGYAAL